MSYRQFITVKIPDTNESFDLEVPADQSIEEIMPSILKVLKHSAVNPKYQIPYFLMKENGERLNMAQTFQQGGVGTFGILILDSKPPEQKKTAARAASATPAATAPTPSSATKASELNKASHADVPADTAATSDIQKPIPAPSQAEKPKTKGKTIQELVAKKKKPGVIKPGQSK